MFIMRLLIASLFILSSLLAVNPKHVLACSCIFPGDPAEALRSSTAVFSGKVVSLDIFNRGRVTSSTDPVIVTVIVSEVWKGIEYKTLVVRTVLWGVSCGYEFELGRGYLVYAYGAEDNLRVSLCSRTKPLSAASEDLKVLGEGTVPIMENPSEPNGTQTPLENPSEPKDTQSSTSTFVPITAVVLVLVGLGVVAILVAVVRRRLSH